MVHHSSVASELSYLVNTLSTSAHFQKVIPRPTSTFFCSLYEPLMSRLFSTCFLFRWYVDRMIENLSAIAIYFFVDPVHWSWKYLVFVASADDINMTVACHEMFHRTSTPATHPAAYAGSVLVDGAQDQCLPRKRGGVTALHRSTGYFW